MANTAAMAAVLNGDLPSALLMGISISSLASFGFLLNDLWDREIDRVNNAGHFELSPKRTLKLGWSACVLFLALGLTVSLLVGVTGFYITTAIAIGLVAYSLVLRRLLILPTLAAALLSASPILAPLLLWRGEAELIHWLFAGVIATILASRETMMDIRDRHGDVIGGRKTVPLVFGVRAAHLLVRLVSTTACGALVAIVVFSSSPGRLLWSTLVVFAISYLVVARLPWRYDRESERAAIQQSVLSSRTAMMLVPVLVVSLWWV